MGDGELSLSRNDARAKSLAVGRAGRVVARLQLKSMFD